MATEKSPLSEARPNSLDDFFSRDPLNLADSDIDTIVAELREQRKIWLAAEAAGAKRAPKAKGGEAKTLADPNITLGDLGL